MRLNLHARIEITIAAALLLGSCGANPSNKFSDAERDEIGDLAGDVCASLIAEDETVSGLKGRIEAIESRLSM